MPAYQAILTDVGSAKIATAIIDETPLSLATMAVGDGAGAPVTPTAGQTALVNEVFSAALNRLDTDPDDASYVIVEMIIPVEEGPYFIREVGVFDDDEDLIAVANFPETYKPVAAEGSVRDLVVRLYIHVGSASAVTLSIDPSVVLASREWVEQSVTRRVDSIHSFQSVADMAAGHQFSARGYFPGTDVGGGLYRFDAARNKADHDGVVVVSPTVPWDGNAGALADFLAGTGETDGAGTGVFVRVAAYPSTNAFKAIPIASDLSVNSPAVVDNGVHFLAPNSAGNLKSFGGILCRVVNDTEGAEDGELLVLVNDGNAVFPCWKWNRDGAAISDVGAPAGESSISASGERLSMVERDYVDARVIALRNLRDIDPGDLADLTFRIGFTAMMYNAAKVERQVGAVRWRYLNRGNGTEKTVQFSTLLSSGSEVDVQALYAQGAFAVADPAVSGGAETTATLFPDDIASIAGGRAALLGTAGSSAWYIVDDSAVADGAGPGGVIFCARITTGSGKTGRTALASVTGVKAGAAEGIGSGRLEFRVQQGSGGLVRRGYAEIGFVWGDPTGGDRGTGTINAQAVYDDNVLLTDYVFDLYLSGTTPDKSAIAESYRQSRAKFTDVDVFIEYWKQHQHMPSMPSRDEWEKDGSKSVGDLLQRLWETVELQSLHICQLRDRIDALTKPPEDRA